MESNWSKLFELVSIKDDKLIVNSKESENIVKRFTSIKVHFVFNPLDPKVNTELIQAIIEDEEGSNNSLPNINQQQMKPSIMGQLAITADEDPHLFLCILGVIDGESPHYKILAGIALYLCETTICLFNAEIKTENLSWLQDCLAVKNAIEEDTVKMHKKFFVLVTNWDSIQNLPYGTTGGLKYFETVSQLSGIKLNEKFLENWALDCTLLPDEDNDDFEMTFTEMKERVLSHNNLSKDTKLAFSTLLEPSKLQDLFQFMNTQSYPSTSPQNERDKLEAMQDSSGLAPPQPDESYTQENCLTFSNLDYEKSISNKSNDDKKYMTTDVESANNTIHQVEELETQNKDFSQLSLINDLVDPIEQLEDTESFQNATEEIEKYWEQNMDFNFDPEASDETYGSFNVDFLDINESFILEDTTTSKPQETIMLDPEVESNELHTYIEKPESAEELVSRLLQPDASSKVKLPEFSFPIIKKLALSNHGLNQKAHYEASIKAMELSKVQDGEFKDDTFQSFHFPTASSISLIQEENGAENFQRRALEKGMEHFGKLRLNSTVNFNELVSKIQSTTFGSLAKTPFSLKENFELTNLYLRNSLEFIVKYLEEMDKQFEKNVYFINSQELQKKSAEVKDKIFGSDLDKVKATFGQFLPLIEDKIKMAESEYAKTNIAIQKAEQNSRIEALKLIFRYIEKETEKMSNVESIKDLENLEENLTSFCKSAFIEAITSFNKTLDVDWIEKIQENINSTSSQIRDKIELKFKKNDANKMLKDEKSADLHVANYAQKYKSRLDDVIRSHTFNPEHFVTIQKDAENDIYHEFNSAILDLSTEIQKKSLRSLEIKIEEITRTMQQKIKPRKQKAGECSSGNSSLQVAGSISKQSTKEVKALTPVGVHFSFDLLSASTVNIDGKNRILYGPSPNNIIIGDELNIGKLSDGSNGEISVRDVLTQKNIEKLYPCKFGKIRIETIIAYVLSLLNLHVTSLLNTQSISYLIAVPSSFNVKMWKVFNNAIQIAGINANLVRESTGLLVEKLKTNSIPYELAKKQLIVMVEDVKKDACDIILYEMKDGALKIKGIQSNEAEGWLFGYVWAQPGIQAALCKIPREVKKRTAYVIMRCCSEHRERNKKILKNEFASVTLYIPKPHETLNGTATLSAYACNNEFKYKWNANHPMLKLDELLYTENLIFDSIISSTRHHGEDISAVKIQEINEKVEKIMENLQRGLQLAKKSVHEQFITLTRKHSSNKMIVDSLSQILQEIQKETISAANVESMFNKAKNKLNL